MFCYVLSLNFIRVIYKKIIVKSLVLFCCFSCMHLSLCHPFLLTAVLCLEEILHVLGVLFLFTICEKTTKYFLGPLNVSFGLLVKRKAEINLEIFQRDETVLSLLPSLDGTLCVGMDFCLGWSLEMLSHAKRWVNLWRHKSNWAMTGSSLEENLGERDKSWADN